jgi:group I intron endonuclease
MNHHYSSYLITNIITNKRYVGITSTSLEKRWKRHCADSKHSTLLLHRSIKKHGTQAFTVTLLEEYARKQEALEGERRLIQTYDTFGMNGYNMTLGGDGLTGYRFTIEQRKQFSIKVMGSRNPFYGKKHSLVTLKQMSESHKKTIHSQENLEKLSEIGRQNGLRNKGKKHTIEAKKRMSNSRKKKIIQLDLEFNVIAIHESTLDAGHSLGIRCQYIHNCLKNPTRKAANSYWRYF